jgi:tol-pal system protein YbgF
MGEEHVLKKLVSLGLFSVLLGGMWVAPAWAQKKDTLLLMQRLDTMQQMLINLQKTVDTQTAVLKTLVEQANNNVNSMKASVDELKKATGQNLANNNARFDSMTSQIQSLGASLEESQARMAKLSDQIAQMQNTIQTLSAPPVGAAAPGANGAAAQPGAATPPPVPDAETLYKSGLSAFSSGQYQLAIQSFQEYLQYYGDTDLASNAQFYIGECYYSQGDYAKAIEEYNKCIEQYPKGNKAAAAQLKKGYALLEMEQRQAGVRELRSLIQRSPNAPESDLARQRLRKLGIAVSGGRGE